MLLVEILLKRTEGESVAFFISSVGSRVDLQTLVGEVDELVFVLEVVRAAGRAEVPLMVDVNSEVVGDEAPDANVELALLVQKRLFNVLLNYPEGVLLVLLEDKLSDVAQILHYFDAPALVQRCRLHHPHVLLTVPPRHAFVLTASIADFSEPVHEHLYFPVILRPRNHIGSRRRVENCVICHSGLLVLLVVRFE